MPNITSLSIEGGLEESGFRRRKIESDEELGATLKVRIWPTSPARLNRDPLLMFTLRRSSLYSLDFLILNNCACRPLLIWTSASTVVRGTVMRTLVLMGGITADRLRSTARRQLR